MLGRQQSKALRLSAGGITTDPGSIPGCITTGRDWESPWDWLLLIRSRKPHARWLSRSDHRSCVFSLFYCWSGRELGGHSMLDVVFVYFYVVVGQGGI